MFCGDAGKTVDFAFENPKIRRKHHFIYTKLALMTSRKSDQTRTRRGIHGIEFGFGMKYPSLIAETA